MNCLVEMSLENPMHRVALPAHIMLQTELGRNSIDIWNLRLELGRKLRQGLKMLLGTRFLAVG